MAYKYNLNSYENIYNLFKNRFQSNLNISNWNKDSVARNMSEPLVQELNRINNETSSALDSIQASKASGPDLDNIASSYGVTRIGPSRSRAEEVDFNFYFYSESLFGDINGGQPIIIPKGTAIKRASRVNGSRITYFLKENVILPPAAKIKYCSVECSSIGSAGNVGKNALSSHEFTNYADSNNGSLLCNNRFPIATGRNAESDEDLRGRIFNKFASLNVLSQDNIRMKFLETPGIYRTRFVKNWFGMGTSAMFVFGANNDVRNSSIRMLQGKIDDLGLTSRITVVSGIKVYLDLEITVWVNSKMTEEAKDEMKRNINRAALNFFVKNQERSDISLGNFINDINEVVPGIKGVSNRSNRSKMIDSAYIRKGYASDSAVGSERVKLTSLRYTLKENEFVDLGNLIINIEEE